MHSLVQLRLYHPFLLLWSVDDKAEAETIIALDKCYQCVIPSEENFSKNGVKHQTTSEPLVNTLQEEHSLLTGSWIVCYGCLWEIWFKGATELLVILLFFLLILSQAWSCLFQYRSIFKYISFHINAKHCENFKLKRSYNNWIQYAQ